MNETRRVVVTGVGIVSPSGIGAKAHLDGLLTGECFIRDIVPPGLTMSQARIAGQVARCLQSPFGRHYAFAASAVREALEQSRLDPRRSRTGLSFGTAIATSKEVEEKFRGADGLPNADLRFGVSTDRLADHFGIRSPRFTVTTGCAAGIDAVGIAFDQIRLGKATTMVAVADPFSGSGTTGVIALEHGRTYIGIEKNPVYAMMAERMLMGVSATREAA